MYGGTSAARADLKTSCSERQQQLALLLGGGTILARGKALFASAGLALFVVEI